MNTNEYLWDAKKTQNGPRICPTNLALEDYSYDQWFTEESDCSTRKCNKEELDELTPFEGDQEAKKQKGLKILTPNKLLTRLPNY